jgi:hypothetical protein
LNAGALSVDADVLSVESELVWRRRSRRPHAAIRLRLFFKNFGVLHSTSLNATWYESEAKRRARSNFKAKLLYFKAKMRYAQECP